MEKLFKAEQQMKSFDGKLEITFKATPLAGNNLVRIQELKINGEDLKVYYMYTFNEKISDIELDEISSQRLGRIAGRPVKKGKRVGIKVGDEVQQVFAEARRWALETRKELQEQAFLELDDSSNVKITFGGRDVFIHTESTHADDSAWVMKTSELLKRLGDSFAEKILGAPTNVYVGDYSIERTWETTLGRLKELRAAAEREVEEIERRKAEKKAEREAERRAKFEEAARTGKPVELERYHTGCNDPKLECDLDVVIVYAMPDGTTQEKRHHTF